jgi:transmembrane sensor
MDSTPTPEQLEELILRSLQGRTSQHEEKVLEEWLQASAAHRDRYDELRRVWRLADRASPAVRSLRRPSAEDLVGRDGPGDITAKGPERPPSTESRVARGSRWVRWAAPLAVAATVAAVALGFHALNDETPETLGHFGVAEFSTGPQETVTARLGDGSIVRVGPSSVLRMDGTDGSRNVWLEGQAFFAVAHNPDAPFTVRTSSGTAQVLGTRFDVRARDSELRLVVVDGRVRVAAGPDERYSEEVGASEMSQVVGGERVYVSQVSDVYELLDWMEGSLIFQATPLETVAKELERRYGVLAEVVDPGVATRRITAWFNDEPLDTAVTVICRAADVRCDVEDGRVRIGL